MEFGRGIWIILQILIGYNLILPIFLFLIWWFFSRKKPAKSNSLSTSGEIDYAIIVTAYEETENLKSVVASINNINYDNYLIYIVADKCDVSNLHFDSQKVILLRPAQTIASNTGSHQYAIDHFVRPHQRLTIIDSDNLVDEEYLNELNVYFDQGYRAVQGLRAAKNLDTTFSSLDAARDIYYHFYDGKILHQLGSSATLSGSGMAFETALYISFLKAKQVKGAGFDKILQYFIVSKNLRIAFAEDAIVFDEKTSQTDQLVKQRARWINTWFKYFGLGFLLVANSLKKMSINQFLFGIVLLRPPLFIFIIVSVCCFAINVVLGSFIASAIWFAALLLFVLGFLLSLWLSHTDHRIYASLRNIPRFIFLQVISLLKSRNANKHSVSTRHFHNQEIEQLKNED